MKLPVFCASLTLALLPHGAASAAEFTILVYEPAAEAAARTEAALLGGYFVIDVADLATAESWARRVPGGATRVEVRPHRPNPAMRPDAPRAQ